MAIGSIFAGLLSAMSAAQANQSATNLGYEQLNFQKQLARDQRRLATAARTDAYGNTVSFDELLNKWITDLTDTQEQILRSGEREQLLSLTEDAERNRATRRRQEDRALASEDVFDRLLSEYQFEQPPDEDAIRGELNPLIGATREEGLKRGSSALAGQAARLGRGGDLASILKRTNDELGSSLSNDLLKTRGAAFNESTARSGAHESKYLPALRQFAQFMDAVGGAPQLFSDAPGRVSQTQDSMLSAIMNAMGSEASNVGNAYNNLARIASNSSIDLSGIGSGIDSLFSGMGGGSSAASTRSGASGGPVSVSHTPSSMIPIPRPNPLFYGVHDDPRTTALRTLQGSTF